MNVAALTLNGIIAALIVLAFSNNWVLSIIAGALTIGLGYLIKRAGENILLDRNGITGEDTSDKGSESEAGGWKD